MKLPVAALLPTLLLAASDLSADPAGSAENGAAGILYWVAPMASWKHRIGSPLVTARAR